MSPDPSTKGVEAGHVLAIVFALAVLVAVADIGLRSDFSIVTAFVCLTSIWVAHDASRLGAGRVGLSPVSWFLLCLLVWIVAFPLYLVFRPKIKAATAAASNSGGATAIKDTVSQFTQPPQALPPPGWYPDRNVSGKQNYWDGTAWALVSKADELTKLDALRRSGAVTQEEFDREKAKLLR
jgi:hypothetical protein